MSAKALILLQLFLLAVKGQVKESKPSKWTQARLQVRMKGTLYIIVYTISLLSLVHTSDISISTKIDTKTKHDLSSGTCKYKSTRICLCFVFCSALGLCFDYVLMLVLMSLYMSQASLHSFVLPFVCPYMLMLMPRVWTIDQWCEPGFSQF